MVILNFIFGLFWMVFALFFMGGIIFLATNSPEETGLDEIGTPVLFFVFIIVLGIALLLIYSREKMSTSTDRN